MERAVCNSPRSTWMWRRKKLLFYCNNHSIIDIWHKGSMRSPGIMALVRILYFIAARYNFNNIMITNLIADALSHFQNHRFCQLAPDAQPLLDYIPAWPTIFVQCPQPMPAHSNCFFNQTHISSC